MVYQLVLCLSHELGQKEVGCFRCSVALYPLSPRVPFPPSAMESEFWNTVVVKQSNDVTRLQALVDKKKVLITKAVIRDVLRLDDGEGVDCQPNEEIFAKLARIGYEKPSTKLTFYKAFFSSQWKFLIYTILQSISAKRTSWNEFSTSMASAVICLSTGRKFNFSKYIFESLVRNVNNSSKFYMYLRFIQLMIQNQLGDLSTYSTRYTSPTLTQKFFANMRRVGKGCLGVETPLFEGMLVEEKPEEQGDADEEVQGVDTAVSGDDVHDQSIPSPAPPTPPPQPPQDIPSTSQERMIAKLDRDTGVALMDDEGIEKKVKDAQVAGDEQVKGRQAEIYQIDMDHTSKVLSMQEDEPEVQEVVEVVTTVKLITEVVAAVNESVSAASATIAVVLVATITLPQSKLMLLLPKKEKEWLSGIQKRNHLQKYLLKPSPKIREKEKW
nr:hypothetical protein [Tanacetum cinerariifolium]